MSSQDRTLEHVCSGNESSTPLETSCPHVSMVGVETMCQSIGEFSFASPTPSPSPRVQRSKRESRKILRIPFGKMKTETREVCEGCIYNA